MSKLINCKSCDQEISKEAQSCPKCGAPVKKKVGCLMQIGYAFLGVFGLMVISSIFSKKGESSNDNSSKIEAVADSSQSAVSAKDDNQTVAKKIGDEIVFEDSKWTVISAENLGSTLKSPSPGLIENKQTEGRFIKVKYTITNTSKDEETLMHRPKILSGDGAKYEQSTDVSIYLGDGEKEFTLDSLPSRIKKTFVAIYEVPKDASKLRFQTRSLESFGTKHIEVDLGF